MIFTSWWDSTAKRCQIIFLKMFVKKVFRFVKPFLANLNLSSSNKNTHICTQWPQNFFFLFLHMSIKNTDFKSVDIIGKKYTPKKLFAKNYCKLVTKKRAYSNFAPFFAYNCFVSKFFALFSTVLNKEVIKEQPTPTNLSATARRVLQCTRSQ